MASRCLPICRTLRAESRRESASLFTPCSALQNALQLHGLAFRVAVQRLGSGAYGEVDAALPPRALGAQQSRAQVYLCEDTTNGSQAVECGV